jgi:hypothetical protein
MRRSKNGIILQGLACLKTTAHDSDILLSHVINALADILLIDPGDINSPSYGKLNSFILYVERHYGINRAKHF